MSQNEQGMIYAFSLPGSRMRQSAAQLRRQGQVVDAVALVRRAAQQDDTPASWYALAEELRQTGNWEAAVQVLSRVVSQDQHHPAAWAAMASCLQALGQHDLAADCAYHQLAEDPWSAEADAARDILAALEGGLETKEPRRTQRLIHRGMTAWHSGDREAGERRLRRALRLTADKARLMVTVAMLCMLSMDFDGAMHYLASALRVDPTDSRTLTALSTLYHQLGKRRMALALLKIASRYADMPLEEDGFLTTAWAQNAWREMDDYLNRRMKSAPYRTALLAARAMMHYEHGESVQARQVWKEILAINPDQREAAAMLTAAHEHPGKLICFLDGLTRPDQREMQELQEAFASMELQELLRAGSRPRQLLDWFFISSSAEERHLAMNLFESSDSAELIPYLKELLCRPFLRMELRHWVLVQLARLGSQGEMMMMAGSHYTMIAYQPVDQSKRRSPWRIFLPLLLQESRRTCPAGEMAAFAAALWQMMSPGQRAEAAGSGQMVWCQAMEILFLRMQGKDEMAARTAKQAPVSVRKISRVLRRIGRHLAGEVNME